MEIYLQILALQNQSWFYPHKKRLLHELRSTSMPLNLLALRLLEEFPELRARARVSPPSPKLHFDWVAFGDSTYPSSFYFMEDPPLLLTMLGSPCWSKVCGLSVVGSRKPTRESVMWMDQELGAFVKRERVALISGGAIGIDQAAHALSIRLSQPTVVFLPSGLAEIYPSNLKSWVEPIIKNGGCLLSEFSPSQPIERRLFHHRNRLIAQMGIATLIVQAASKSGSLMTGHLCAMAGKPFWVVPGHPSCSDYQGNLQLLQEGGSLVKDADDLSLFFEGEKSSLGLEGAHIDHHAELRN